MVVTIYHRVQVWLLCAASDPWLMLSFSWLALTPSFQQQQQLHTVYLASDNPQALLDVETFNANCLVVLPRLHHTVGCSSTYLLRHTSSSRLQELWLAVMQYHWHNISTNVAYEQEFRTPLTYCSSYCLLCRLPCISTGELL